MTERHDRFLFYVIMPLSTGTEAELKREIIQEAAVARGFIAHFPEYDKDHTFDLQLMIEQFERAAFIIADLSFERPSCYYELGIAEALGLEVYLFAVEGTNIHQTCNRGSVRFYRDLEHLRALVEEALEQARGDKSTPEEKSPFVA